MSVNHSPTATSLTQGTEQEAEGVLDSALLSELRKGFVMSQADLARRNAVSNNDLDALALNRDAIINDDGHFSHRVKTAGITHQKQSGRCWMFAALNTLRPLVVRGCAVEDFEFSTSYLQFWDRLERSNLYLESIIELRDVDYLDRKWEAVNRWTMEDGGWWNYMVGLIQKYGVVPKSVMPESHSSSKTKTLNEVLGRLVRSRAVTILDAARDGADEDRLRSLKEEALHEVYRFLVLGFGEPPEEFEWRYQRKSQGDQDSSGEVRNEALAKRETFTPRSFYERFVGRAIGEVVCLYHDPKNALNRHYVFKGASNMVGGTSLDFVNIDMATMKKIAVSSILANEPLWFAVNMSFDQSEEHGLMHDRLFDYESLFGLDLSLSKADRARFHLGVSNHAMALMGVDLDEGESPRKWLVENSWGGEKGRDGWWTLHDSWFDEHVYTIMVHRRHVPAEILQRFDEEATELPEWYPGAAGVA